jgi:hypothetical protein
MIGFVTIPLTTIKPKTEALELWGICRCNLLYLGKMNVHVAQPVLIVGEGNARNLNPCAFYSIDYTGKPFQLMGTKDALLECDSVFDLRHSCKRSLSYMSHIHSAIYSALTVEEMVSHKEELRAWQDINYSVAISKSYKWQKCIEYAGNHFWGVSLPSYRREDILNILDYMKEPVVNVPEPSQLDLCGYVDTQIKPLSVYKSGYEQKKSGPR